MATPDNTTTLPSPPFYTHIPNINNLRLATHSLTTQSGATLRPNLLFRSAEVSKVDAEGWTALRQLGVGHVFDLRSKPEIDKGHSNNDNNNNSNSKDDANADAVVGSKAGGEGGMQEAGLLRTWVPVFEESDYSPERLAERYAKYMDQDVRGFVEAYSEFLKSGGNAYGVILRYLANLSASAPGQEEGEEEGVRRPRGALIHCTAGKDRTGMFFGLLFDFLGVPRDQIATEYHLTQRGLSGVREQVVARLLASPAFTKYMTAQASGTPISPGDIAKALHDDAARGSSAGSDGDKQIPQEILDKGREAALRMVSARKESMLGALEMLDRQFGGAERYMREVCGLGDGELEGLRRNLLVGYGRGA